MTDEQPTRFTPLDADGNPAGETIDIPNGTGWRLTGPEGKLIAESMPLTAKHHEAADEAHERLYAAGELHLPDGTVHDMADVMIEGATAPEIAAELIAKGWKESVAAAAVRTVTSPDPYADASDDEHCRHGYPYPDCAVCHRTAGGAPNREPGEHDPAAVGAALGLQATVERLKNENAEMKARLGIDPNGYSREPGELEQLRAEVAELRTAFESCKGRYRDYVDASRAHTKRQDAEIERLGTELAQANRELGEQRALADAMQAGIDQCSNTHDIDWPGDE